MASGLQNAYMGSLSAWIISITPILETVCAALVKFQRIIRESGASQYSYSALPL